MSIPELLTLRAELSSIKDRFFHQMKDGKITSGLFESQKIETVYFAMLPANRITDKFDYGFGHTAMLFSPTILELALLNAPIYSREEATFLLEVHPDGTFSGAWLAPHEKDALLAKWEEAGQC